MVQFTSNLLKRVLQTSQEQQVLQVTTLNDSPANYIVQLQIKVTGFLEAFFCERRLFGYQFNHQKYCMALEQKMIFFPKKSDWLIALYDLTVHKHL